MTTPSQDTALRILNLEDSALDSELLEHQLKFSGIDCHLKRVENERAFRDALESESYDLILCDYNLPTYNGIQATRLAAAIQPDTPVIIISGSIGEELAVECMHVGAADYVLKQRPERFPIAVRRAVESAKEQRRLRVAEARLRESELQLRTVLESIHEVIWRAKPGHIGIIYLSPAFERVWGRPVMEVIHQPQLLLDSIHPLDRPRFLSDIERQAAGEPTFNEYRILRPDGSIRWIYDQGFPILNPDKSVSEIHGIAADITDSKRFVQWEINRRISLELLATGAPLSHVLSSILTRLEEEYPDWLGVFLLSQPYPRLFQGLRAQLGADEQRILLESLGVPAPAISPQSIDFPKLPQLHTLLSRPVESTRHAQLGHLVIYQRTPRVPTPTEIRTIEDTANLAGIAIEQRTGEEALRASQHLNQAILDSVSAEIAVLDRHGTIIAVNKPWETFAAENSAHPPAPSPKTGLGVNYLEVCQRAHQFHPDPNTLTVFHGIQAVLLGHQPSFTTEYLCPIATHHKRFTMVVTPLHTNAGGAVVAHIDITSRKQAELEADLQRRRVTGIIESSMDAIITIDEDQRILVFNPAAERMFLCPAKEAIGKSIDRFLPEKSRHEHAHHVLKFAQSHDATRPMGRRGEVHGRRSNGEEFPMESSISRIELNGQCLLTVNCRDVTQNHIAEKERLRLQQHLLKSQKMEAIGTLAGGIAHDFNNILGVIMGNTEMARMDLVPESAAADSLDQIWRASLRAKELVRQILTFSRQNPLEQRVILLHPVIEETIGLLRSTLPASIDLSCQIDPDSPAVLADGTQIHQVLMNLCTNAWHAIGQTTGHIRIELNRVQFNDTQSGEDLAPGIFACLSITDDGRGMDSQTLDRMFEPFFTTKRTGEGTGLGLAVVHGIVKSHGGTTRVQSSPGQGTTFRIYLPAADRPPETVVTGARSLPHGNQERILIVDDEAPLAILSQRILNRLHYVATPFTRPEEALRAFRQDPDQFDLGIIDLNMPGMNGIELSTQLLRIRPNFPILLASGFVSDQVQQDAIRTGIRGVLSKPLSIEVLSHNTHKHLD